MFEVSRNGAPERVKAPYERAASVLIGRLDESGTLGMVSKAPGMSPVKLNILSRPIANK